ncbi:hypothetical protein ABIC59_000755 [Priestia aryabhattai]
MSRRSYPIVRKCSCCLRYKELHDFNKDSRTSLGISAQCKKCSNRKKLNRYHKRKAKQKELYPTGA